jgi:hypothetical protein
LRELSTPCPIVCVSVSSIGFLFQPVSTSMVASGQLGVKNSVSAVGRLDTESRWKILEVIHKLYTNKGVGKNCKALLISRPS